MIKLIHAFEKKQFKYFFYIISNNTLIHMIQIQNILKQNKYNIIFLISINLPKHSLFFTHFELGLILCILINCRKYLIFFITYIILLY